MKGSVIEQHTVKRPAGSADNEAERFTNNAMDEALETHEQHLQSIDLLKRLQRVTSHLSNALTMADIAKVIVEEGAKALACSQGVMNVVNGAGDALEPLYFYGYPEEIMAHYRHIPLGFQSPITDIVHSHEIIFLEDQTAQRKHYPHIADEWLKAKVVALVAVPLLSEGKVVGTLGYSFPTARRFGVQDKSFLLALAEQCAQAFRRTLVYEAERAARERYQTLFNAIDEGYCVFEMLFDKAGKPSDYRFLEVNPAFEGQTGLRNAVGKTAKELVPNLEQHWLDVYGNVALTGQALRFEQGSTAMGRYFDVYALRVGGDTSRKVALVFNDISQRKLIEENLQRSEAHFRTLAETLPGFVWMDSAGGSNIYMNARWTEFTGQTLEEAREGGWRSVTHPDDIPRIEDRWQHCRATGETYELEIRHRRKDGDYCWFLAKGLPLYDAAGNIVNWVGTSIDITERKRAEEALNTTIARFARAEAAAQGFVFEWNIATGVVERSVGVETLLGYTRAELTASFEAWHTLVHPDDLPKLHQEQRLALEQGSEYSVEFRVRHKHGHYLYVWDRGQIERDSSGRALRILGTTVDITERNHNEQALQKANELFERAEVAANGFIYEWELATGKTTRSPGFSKLLGYPNDEIAATAADWRNLLHPDDLGQVMARSMSVLEQTGHYSAEYRVRHKDGHYLWVWDQGSFHTDSMGNKLIVGSTVDISTKKLLEQTLRESEDRYRSLVKASTHIVWTTNAEGFNSEPQPGWLEFTGQRWEDEQGYGWLEVIHPEDRERVRASWQSAIENKTFYFEKERLRHHDGTYHHMEVRAAPVFNDNGTVREWIGTHTDVTERVVNERLLTKQTRLLHDQAELLSLTNEAIIVRDGGDRIVSWNKAACDLYDYREEEAIGQISHELLQTDFASSRADMETALEETGFWEGEVTHRRKDGEKIVSLSRQALRRDEAGHPLEIVEVNWDITARKQVEIEREKLLELTQRSEKEALALAEIASSFSLAKPFETNLNSIAERLVKATDAAACAIELFEPDALTLRLSGSYGYPASAMEQGLLQVRQNNVETLSQRAISKREVVIIRDYIAWALRDARRAPLHPYIKDLDWGTAVVVPLPTSKGQGAVNVFYPKGTEPTMTDLLQLSTIVSQITLVVENTQLFEEAQGKAALEERQRLARDLHDSVSQALYGISLGAQSAKQALHLDVREARVDGLERSLDYLIHMAETAIAEMKSLIFELRPESLASEGLVVALQKHLRALELRHGFRLHLTLGQEPDVPLKVKEMLYRITQEAMNNIVKHARAKNVWIALETREGELELTVRDDGIGFDTTRDFPGHLGLRSMHERAEAVGASYELSSHQQKGTKIRVTLALPTL
jgi:PAS domain S-box-containing protein